MEIRPLIDEFGKALENLQSVLSMPVETDLEKAGCIQYFEFSFELAWKSIQAVTRELGLPDCNSPKASLKQAFSQKWINDELVWLQMLSDRNRMSHTYNAEDALAVYGSLKTYLPAFKELLRSLKNEV